MDETPDDEFFVMISWVEFEKMLDALDKVAAILHDAVHSMAEAEQGGPILHLVRKPPKEEGH